MCSRISALLMLMGIALITRVDECRGAAEYYGRYIGPLSRLFHSVSGDVYAVDARTIHIRDFTYDGEGPAAYFYAGNTKAVGPGGFIVRDETGSNGVLKKYNKKHVTVTLPEGKTLNNIRWISVWCEEFQVNFGDIQIPRGIDYPKPQKIGALSGVHGVSSENIVVVDAQTLLIPSFSYDGEAPDAKFWVGRGPKPSPQGIRVPDENGKQAPLRRYDRKTIVLTLPGELTIFDIGHFGVWCEAFTVDFGHLQIPPALNVPPSLKMLGVSPQSKLNCEVLSDDLAYEIRWAVAGDSIVIQLVAKLESGEYMSFGPSGDDNHSVMVGGDVVVAWVDQATLNGYAMDYYLDAKSQCSGTRGSCPDYRIELNTESVRLLNAALVNGYSIVTYQRPLKAHDGLDRPILTTKSQPIIWAVGPLNQKQEVSYHSITSKGDVFIDFGRPPKWNCPIPDNDAVPEKQDLEQHESIQNSRSPPQQQLTQAEAKKESTTVAYRTPPTPAPAPKNNAWVIPPIQCNEPDDRVFYAQMGPTGGKQGYPAITGHVGWGISYYINGLLIPEIHVVRGYTYTFIVEGGMDPNIPAKFHPFYITDDPVGGYQYKTPEERRKVNIYAGAELNKHGEVVPTGLGRLCNWTPDPDHAADDYASFGAYQRTLTLVCDHGIPASIQWTPDKDTPDTVYYQCFVHRYLGWKIHVHDRCDLPSAAGSEPVPSVVLPGDQDELQANPSVFVTTRVKPEFPPQSIKYFEPKGKKNFTKSNFPYEIQKVSMPDFNEINSSVPEHVIPVKEEVEDIPDATTYRMTYTNMTLEPPTMPPVTHKNHNYRPDFSPPPLPQSAPSHHNQRHPNQRHPPVKTIMVRRPVHHFMKPPPPPNRNGGPPPPAMLHHSASQSRPVIVKKPLIRLPQRPGMMSPPPPNHMSQRPMQGPPPPPPPPPSRPPKPMYVHKFKKPHPTSHPEKSKHKMQPSPMISQKPEEGTTRMPIAVNTGFNPGSLVIESGFKPIINTPQVAEDRVSEVDYDDEEESVGVIKVEGSDDRKSQTEMFEPMFIPSPLDSNDKTKKMTTQPVKKIRKQVVHVRPVYNHDEPQFRSEQDDLSLQSSRKTPVLAYDGKTVAKDSVPGSPAGATQSEVTDVTELTKQPQYGPFKGDPPPPVPSVVLPSDIPQLNVQPAVGKEKEESVGDDEKNNVRERRSPHHEPGHLEDHDHDHHGHDHSAHSHNSTMTSSASLIVSSHLGLAIICVALMKYL